MKNCVLILLSVLAVSNFANAKISEKIIHEASPIGKFLVELSGLAEEGSHLAYFNTAYTFWQPSLDMCQFLTPEETVKKALAILSMVYNDALGEVNLPDPKTIKTQLENYFENKDYYYCTDNVTVFMGFNEIKRFISKDFQYRLQWTIGYED